jgi:hypothetical protein
MSIPAWEDIIRYWVGFSKGENVNISITLWGNLQIHMKPTLLKKSYEVTIPVG